MSDRACSFPNFCQAHLSVERVPYRGSPALPGTSNVLRVFNLSSVDRTRVRFMCVVPVRAKVRYRLKPPVRVARVK